MSGEKVSGPTFVLSRGRPFGPPVGCATTRAITRKSSARAISEAVWARAGRDVLSNFSKWIGAPFAEDGLNRAEANRGLAFSRTRRIHDSRRDLVPDGERTNGSRMGKPPSPPRVLAQPTNEAGTSRLFRSQPKRFGCPQREKT